MCKKYLIGSKVIFITFLLLLLSPLLFGDYYLSDLSTLRLKVLIVSWLNKTQQASNLLDSSTSILIHSNQSIDQMELNLNLSGQIIKNLSGTTLNLKGLLLLSQMDLKKQKQLLDRQSINSLLIAGACIIGGAIIGYLSHDAINELIKLIGGNK